MTSVTQNSVGCYEAFGAISFVYEHDIEGGSEMNQYITGATIKELREQRKMTQLQLAEILKVSDKTISKWETAKGYPDITLLEPIADAFGISVPELILYKKR